MSDPTDLQEPALGPRLRAWACRVTGAEPQELGRALGLFLYNFLVITAYLIIKPVRNSLFLDRLGAENLPYAYIGTALFVGVAVWAYNRLLDSLTRTRVVLTTWGALGAGLVLFWFGFRQPGVLISGFFYFFTAVFAVMGVTQFWSFAAEVLDARQGRRLFAFVQAGGILGGLAGSLLTRYLATWIGTEQLLLLSATLCFLCGGLAGYQSQIWPVEPDEDEQDLYPEAPPEEDSEAMAAAGGFGLVRGSRYLGLICLMLLCFQLVSTMVDFQFQYVVDQALPLKDERTAFYGTFFLLLNLSSLAFQFLVTTWVHRNHGLGPSLLFLPVAGLLGAVGFFLAPVFWMGCLLRGSFGALDYSLDRATRELLWLPTAREVKYKAKAFLDMFCFRFFRSLAGILILFVESFGEGSQVRPLSLAVFLACLAWLLLARATRRENIRQLRQALLGTLDTEEGPEELSPEERRLVLVEIGFELRRVLEVLSLPGLGAVSLAQRSGRRLRILAGRLYGASDVAGALGALDGPSAHRALALELLDGIGDPWIGRPLFRSLDPRRPLEERVEFLELVLGRIGELPLRPEKRKVWTAAPPGADDETVSST